MPSILSIAVCAALLLVDGAYAAPTKSRLGKRSFIIEREAYGTYTRNGPVALRRAFAKFGMTLPADLPPPPTQQRDAASSAGSGSSGPGTSGSPPSGSSTGGSSGNSNSANPPNQAAEFWSPMKVGGKMVKVIFDTGSSDLILASTNQPADQLQGRTSVYDQTKSPTFKRVPNQSWNISYGDKSNAHGSVVGTDIVDIGGVHTTQAIELADYMSPSFVADPTVDGLVGLAFSSINQVTPTPQKTFFDNVQNDLAEPVFTAALRDGTPGTYSFGKIDYPTPLNFTPVDDSQGFWQFPSSTFEVGGDATRLSNKENSPAIADTGTSLLLVDQSVVSAYYAKVAGAANDASQNGYVYPCTSTVPSLGLALGDSQYGTIPANLMTYGKANDTHCYGSLQWNQAQGFQIYGDILFKAMFVAFNIRDKTIAFAPHV